MKTTKTLGPIVHRLSCRLTVVGLFTVALAVMAGPAAAHSPSHDTAPPPVVKDVSAITPPAAAAVLQSIYQVDSQGADSYEIANGAIATYWYGHAFELGGTHYFTGFAWETGERYGKQGEDNPAPDTQVNVTEATYTLTDPASPKPWKFRGMTNAVGKFGAFEKPEDIDTRRKPLEYRTPAGKLVLAVPTVAFANGVSLSGYALFRFNPTPFQDNDLKDKAWLYLGRIDTGEDNAAACDGGEVMPCVGSDGALSFAAQGNSDMPQVTVKFTGTAISGPDKTRQLGAADNAVYAYDASSMTYQAK